MNHILTTKSIASPIHCDASLVTSCSKVLDSRTQTSTVASCVTTTGVVQAFIIIMVIVSNGITAVLKQHRVSDDSAHLMSPVRTLWVSLQIEWEHVLNYLRQKEEIELSGAHVELSVFYAEGPYYFCNELSKMNSLTIIFLIRYILFSFIHGNFYIVKEN